MTTDSSTHSLKKPRKRRYFSVLKGPLRRVLKNPRFIACISKLIRWYIQFVYRTTAWEIIGHETFTQHAYRTPAIYLFWHGRMLMMPCLFALPKHMHIVISEHRDGELIAQVMHHFGFKTIRGSTDRNSARAFRNIVRALKHGDNVSITPDGPRGPRMHINSNVTAIARFCQVPIIPVTFSTNQRYIHQSWDRFMLAKPHGRGVIIFGDAITIPRACSEEEMEQYKLRITDQLNAMTHRADLAVGHVPILPEHENLAPKRRPRS